MGKIDAVELRYDGGFDGLSIRDWYKYLNCGYRLPAVGGTDKMSAGMVAGGLRTYADLGDAPFTMDAWTNAVRAGRTFSSTGALLFLRAMSARLARRSRSVPAGPQSTWKRRHSRLCRCITSSSF